MNYKNILLLELIWWLLTLVICVLILYPIYSQNIDFPFYTYNIIYIIALITITRHIFLLKYTFLAKAKWIKLIIIFISIPAIVLLGEGISKFQAFLDEEAMQSILIHLPSEKVGFYTTYIRQEYILFGVGTVISMIVLPIRMIISIWRVRNTNKV